MNSKRFYFVMLGAVGFAVVVLLVGVFVGNKLLSKQAKQLTELKLETYLLEEQQNALTRAQREVEKYEDFTKIAAGVVPQDKDQARTVLELAQIANEAGLAIDTFGFQTSNLGTAAPKPVVTPTDSKTTTDTPAASKPAEPTVSQTKAVEGIKGVFAIPIELNVRDTDISGTAITYDQIVNFLSLLENNRRTAQVTNISISPKMSSNLGLTYDVSLTVNTYVKP